MTTIRNFNTDSDISNWLELNHKIAQLDDYFDYGDEWLKETLKYPNHNADSDRWLIEDNDHLVGHAWIVAKAKERAYFEVALLPYFRKKELANEVFELVKARAQASFYRIYSRAW